MKLFVQNFTVPELEYLVRELNSLGLADYVLSITDHPRNDYLPPRSRERTQQVLLRLPENHPLLHPAEPQRFNI